jgi:hypothetical protein
MLCPSCHGQHWVIRGDQMVPCPECGGMGEIHCCDGLTAEMDPFETRCVFVERGDPGCSRSAED